ncbi:hypothetical protein BK816_04790 [Boudabousia tangfeifanii]|uniref:Uncharacterized protein n=1 Tax=Boudabousia tangfeifanii TaxID=1912795 RepID=A0A1D9MKK1_9ACTO|nr:hypothetical protein [Boudabousia tangfeifanii]AOZ72690.1 hypothetical protein BK816_04790 [Boudabousia tangfeifanii]
MFGKKKRKAEQARIERDFAALTQDLDEELEAQASILSGPRDYALSIPDDDGFLAPNPSREEVKIKFSIRLLLLIISAILLITLVLLGWWRITLPAWAATILYLTLAIFFIGSFFVTGKKK